ncbi:hypothetical protein BRD18_08095 [Halobacteriales archaeon SW_7_71_33]|nr:MAG: hypothetical protein BRD18_08095 [Halobacteriales archaeon SW_7_71_33]
MNVRQVVPRDAIPSVDDPTFRDAHDDPDDEVIVVESDPPRAYPVRYLDYHEIVNDRLDPDGWPAADGSETDDDDTAPDGDEGLPVAVTWCPLCGSAVVYSRRVAGHELEFGVSGKLADDDLVMYDRQTGTEWKQSTGEAIAGELAGERLTALPAATTTWRALRDRSPAAVVLAPPGGRSEAAGEGDDPAPVEYDDDPYRAYFEADGFGLAAHRGEGSREDWSLDLDPKAVVLGVERDGDAAGVPVEWVREAGGAVRLSVGDDSAVVLASEAGAFAYAAPPFDDAFERVEPDRFAADGATWDAVTGESDDGRRLRRLPVRRLFAFAWRDDHGTEAFRFP